jgi:Domain of unknown function (DUF397)
LKEPKGPVTWRKAARCGGGECVEVALLGSQVGLRDSNDLPVIFLSRTGWDSFITGIKAGEFDLG